MSDPATPSDEKPTESAGMCRGDLGENRAETADSPRSRREGQATPAQCSIDLTKRGDVAMVHRAIVNNWDVSDEMKRQICEQLPAAIDLAIANADQGNYRRLFKIVRVMLLMDVSNRVQIDGVPKSRFRFLNVRRRGKERRTPRHRREAQDSGADLERLMCELTTRGISLGAKGIPGIPASPPPRPDPE